MQPAEQAGASNGLETRRLFVARYEPNATSCAVALLAKIIDPDLPKHNSGRRLW